MKKRIISALRDALERAFSQGILKRTEVGEILVEVPANQGHGHFATNLCLTLAKSQKMPPMKIASLLVPILGEESIFERVEAAAPGFLNFFIGKGTWTSLITLILSQGEDYGRSSAGMGKSVLVEFVSANPTGPLHLGHGRGAALGDTLCRILSFAGYKVEREFYINDAGRQIRLLGESVYARWQQMTNPSYPFPADGYHGEYVTDLARMISMEADLGSMSDEEATDFCSSRGKEIMMEDIKRTLKMFRVEFDVWFSETHLHNSGLLEKSLSSSSIAERLYEKDGALWIATTLFGDDKDRVIRKSDGSYTYFASDIAYHRDKRQRGFDKAIDIWGADHHGYIPRVKAALAALGIPKEWLSVLLIQLVKLWKQGTEVKMSKRAGTYVTLQELMEEVGVDAARFVFLTKHNDSPLDVDVDLIKKQESDNPVFYVQYAHARACSIMRKALDTGDGTGADHLELLGLEEEMYLIRLLADFPDLIEEMARALEPHRLTYYLQELSSAFHRYFNLGNKNPDCRVITDDKALSSARLSLVGAVRTVLANGLGLLAITAPERM